MRGVELVGVGRWSQVSPMHFCNLALFCCSVVAGCDILWSGENVF